MACNGSAGPNLIYFQTLFGEGLRVPASAERRHLAGFVADLVTRQHAGALLVGVARDEVML
jgi:hypothetical protein